MLHKPVTFVEIFVFDSSP